MLKLIILLKKNLDILYNFKYVLAWITVRVYSNFLKNVIYKQAWPCCQKKEEEEEKNTSKKQQHT